SRTRSPSLRAITRKPSCLISCSHRSPEGNLSVFVGRHGAMKPADMALQFGGVPVGLGKMLLFLGTIHGFAPTTRSPGRKSPGAFPFLCIGAIWAASVGHRLKLW